jgi:hypothetical protein
MNRLVRWVWRIRREAWSKSKIRLAIAVHQKKIIESQDEKIAEYQKEIDRLKSIRVETDSQIKQLTLDCAIKDRNIEHLTLIIARDRERVSAELAQYAAAASGVPVKSVTTDVLSRVTPQ